MFETHNTGDRHTQQRLWSSRTKLLSGYTYVRFRSQFYYNIQIFLPIQTQLNFRNDTIITSNWRVFTQFKSTKHSLGHTRVATLTEAYNSKLQATYPLIFSRGDLLSMAPVWHMHREEKGRNSPFLQESCYQLPSAGNELILQFKNLSCRVVQSDMAPRDTRASLLQLLKSNKFVWAKLSTCSPRQEKTEVTHQQERTPLLSSCTQTLQAASDVRCAAISCVNQSQNYRKCLPSSGLIGKN